METLYCTRERTYWWRRQRRCKGRGIETKVKQEWTDGHVLYGEHSSVVSKSVPPLICVSSYHRDLRRFKACILSTRAVNNKTCLLINTTRCFTLPFHSTESRVSRSNWNSSHVANSASEQPTFIISYLLIIFCTVYLNQWNK